MNFIYKEWFIYNWWYDGKWEKNPNKKKWNKGKPRLVKVCKKEADCFPVSKGTENKLDLP